MHAGGYQRLLAYLGHAVYTLTLLHARQDLILHQLGCHRLGLVGHSLHTTPVMSVLPCMHAHGMLRCSSRQHSLVWPLISMCTERKQMDESLDASSVALQSWDVHAELLVVHRSLASPAAHLSSWTKALLDELVCVLHCVLLDHLHQPPAEAWFFKRI